MSANQAGILDRLDDVQPTSLLELARRTGWSEAVTCGANAARKTGGAWICG